MAYSNKAVENDPSIFPAPQMWMTWVDDIDYSKSNYQAGVYTARGTGKLRHYHTLEAARKGLRWIGTSSKYRPEEQRGKFAVNWSVYHWSEDQQEWVEVYSGRAGEERKRNPLFKIRFTKDQRVHPIDQNREDAAIESILRELGA